MNTKIEPQMHATALLYESIARQVTVYNRIIDLTHDVEGTEYEPQLIQEISRFKSNLGCYNNVVELTETFLIPAVVSKFTDTILAYETNPVALAYRRFPTVESAINWMNTTYVTFNESVEAMEAWVESFENETGVIDA